MKKYVFNVGGETVAVIITKHPADMIPSVKETLKAVYPNERVTVKEVDYN